MRKKLMAFILASVISISQISVLYAKSDDYLKPIDNGINNLEEYKNNELLVLYKNGDIETKKYDTLNELKKAIYYLKNDKNVDVVQPNYSYTKNDYSVNDEFFKKQWALKNDGDFMIRNKSEKGDIITAYIPGIGLISIYQKEVEYNSLKGVDINIEPAWEKYNSKKDVIIALIDTGIDITHDDLKGRIWTNMGEIADNGVDDDLNGYVDDINGYNFYDNMADISSGEDNRHGTHCAGTMVALSNNGIGIAGIAPYENIKVMPVKALGGVSGEGSTRSIAEAIKYAEKNGADICNLSLSTNYNDIILYKTMAKSNMLFVVAAGNDVVGIDNDKQPHYPASYDIDNMIVVANICADGLLDKTSNYGVISTDIAAPGNKIFSTSYNNTYIYMSGTSMAAPMVSAVCALVYSYYDNINLKDTKEIVLNSVTKIDSLKPFVSTSGVINAGAAFEYDISTLKHEDFVVPKEAYVEEKAPEFFFEPHLKDNKYYIDVRVEDINNDIVSLRYMQGSHTKEDFKKGIKGYVFTLDKDKKRTFKINSKGTYTFYAIDSLGNDTLAEINLK